VSVGVGHLGTPESRAALGHAIREATVRDEDLVVVAPEEVARGAEFLADLDLARASLGRREVEVRTIAADADAAAELIDLSFEDGIELLVIGLRRRSPMGKLIMGSTAQKVLLEARCPVTAVKPPVGRAG
jgi:nucleotide-binding universal stress UspA family protein